MKSDLDARPVFLQKQSTIQGHFLVCYLSVLLERILKFKVLNNNYSSSEVFRFVKDFKVVKTNNKYVNLSTYNQFIDDFSAIIDQHLTNYFLTKTQIKKLFPASLKI